MVLSEGVSLWLGEAFLWPSGMTKRSPFRYFKTSPEYPSCARASWGLNSVSLDQCVCGFKELSHDGDDGDLRCGEHEWPLWADHAIGRVAGTGVITIETRN